MFIYKLTNKFDNKIYIGYTTEKSIKERCRKRNCEAKYRKERTSYILNAIRKYGEDAFIQEQLDTANTLAELKEKEIFYIALFDANNRKIGYNLTKGGEGNKGLKMSDETKNKIRLKRLGLKDSKETRLKKSLARLNSNIDFSKGIENCRLHNLKTSKQIEKLDLFGNRLKVYSSITETSKEDKIDRTGLIAYLKSNKAENNKGYKGFIYKEL